MYIFTSYKKIMWKKINYDWITQAKPMTTPPHSKIFIFASIVVLSLCSCWTSALSMSMSTAFSASSSSNSCYILYYFVITDIYLKLNWLFMVFDQIVGATSDFN